MQTLLYFSCCLSVWSTLANWFWYIIAALDNGLEDKIAIGYAINGWDLWPRLIINKNAIYSSASKIHLLIDSFLVILFA